VKTRTKTRQRKIGKPERELIQKIAAIVARDIYEGRIRPRHAVDLMTARSRDVGRLIKCAVQAATQK